MLSAPTLPTYPGMSDFEGDPFHTYWWPKEPVPLAGRRVGVVGTGATGIQVIAEVCDKVAQLRVFQRRPNWSTPLNNAPISEAETRIKDSALEASLRAAPLDVTLPGRPVQRGRLHIATQVMRQIRQVFADLGFQVYRSREVEDDATNFELLNMPPHHPARDMWDTFHTTTPGVILRTHTSPGQIHVMREFCPRPIRVILPGMCYRFEQITTRSEIMFQQVEGLVVDRGITMAHLKGTLDHFARAMFGPQATTRWRPSYFPFTEPSAEFDVWFPEHRDGPRWVEWGGCGMVNPRVLVACGIDPEVYSGFAFGMGIERTLMFRHGISDMRDMVEGDVRFTRAFGMEV